MRTSKSRYLVILALIFFLGLVFSGCATTAQMNALEAKVQQATDTANKALDEAQTTKANSEKCCKDSSDNAQIAQSAAKRAETAAANAEASAKRAEDAANKTEGMYNKIMSK